MNLLEFQNKISSERDRLNKDLFSETITICNILNQNFSDDEIKSININKQDHQFTVSFVSEDITNKAMHLNNAIAPGEFKPLYSINIISRESCSLLVELNQI